MILAQRQRAGTLLSVFVPATVDNFWQAIYDLCDCTFIFTRHERRMCSL